MNRHAENNTFTCSDVYSIFANVSQNSISCVAYPTKNLWAQFRVAVLIPSWGFAVNLAGFSAVDLAEYGHLPWLSGLLRQ